MKWKKDLRLLFTQAFFWSLFYGLTNAFVIPFIVALGVSNTLVGLVSAAPFVAAIIAQLPGAELLTIFGRRKLIATTGFSIGRIMWIVIGLIPFFLTDYINIFWAFFIFFIIWALSGNLGGPSWTSLEASHIPKKIRGAFYARQTKLVAIGITITTLLGGFYLDFFPNSLKGFSHLFILGSIFGLIGVYFISKTKDRPFKPLPVLKNLFHTKKNFRIFTLFNTVFNFALALSAPFFVVYILNDLGASYSLLVVALASGSLMMMLTQYYWGKLADTYGDKPIMIIACLGFAVVPLLYFFITPELIWLIIPAEMIAGASWGGYSIARINLLLDVTEPRKRPIRTAEYVMITSIPMIIAPLLGGYIADSLTFIIAGIPLVFLLSFGLRLISPLFLLKLKEPRIPHEYSVKEVVSAAVNGFHPVRDVGTKVVIGVKHINDLFHGNRK